MAQNGEVRPLFGGAMQMGVPQRFVDVSMLREVPDNQEVFVDPERDESVIIELLEPAPPADLREAAFFHWNDLVAANESTPPQIIKEMPLSYGSTGSEVPMIGPDHCSGCFLIAGRLAVAKFKETARNVVDIFICVIRLKGVETDIVISMNIPEHINPDSSSAKSVDLNNLPNPEQELALLGRIVGSLAVNDWGLFSGDN